LWNLFYPFNINMRSCNSFLCGSCFASFFLFLLFFTFLFALLVLHEYSKWSLTYLSNIIALWKVILVKYDTIYLTIKLVKESAKIVHLMDNIVDDYDPLWYEFLNEKIVAVKRKGEVKIANKFESLSLNVSWSPL